MGDVKKSHDEAEDSLYTEDGTVDIHKKPAIKKKTGNWKACRFILGIGFFFFFHFDTIFYAYFSIKIALRC